MRVRRQCCVHHMQLFECLEEGLMLPREKSLDFPMLLLLSSTLFALLEPCDWVNFLLTMQVASADNGTKLAMPPYHGQHKQ